MYYPQRQQEPGGCMETLLISRIVFGMLLVPFLMVFGAIFTVVLALFAFSVHPLLGLLVLAGCILILVAVGKWESARVKRQMPDEPE